jgi:hypothetical protein
MNSPVKTNNRRAQRESLQKAVISKVRKAPERDEAFETVERLKQVIRTGNRIDVTNMPDDEFLAMFRGS